MNESPLVRLQQLLHEGRFCEIVKIHQKSWRDIFAGLSLPADSEPEEILILAQALQRLGYNRKAYQLLSHAAGRFPGPGILLEYARSSLDYHHVLKALKLLDMVRDMTITRDQHTVMLHVAYARAYTLMGAFQSAEASLARASEYSSSRSSELLVLNQALIYQQKFEWDKAEALLVSFLSAHPDSVDALMQLAGLQVYFQRGEMAVKHFSHAGQIQPESFYPPYNMGYQFLQMGLYGEALEAFLNALHLAPDNDFASTVAWGIGFSLFQENEWEKALTWFRKAQSKDMVRACLNLQLGKTDAQEDLMLELPDLPEEYSKSDSQILNMTLKYFKRSSKNHIQDKRLLQHEFRSLVEETGLKTRGFVAATSRLIALLRLGLPAIVVIPDFEDRQYGMIYGYNPLREIFFSRGAEEKEFSGEDLLRQIRCMDFWALAVFPGEYEERVSSILPKEEDRRFRTLEKAEEDIYSDRLPLAKHRIESLSPGIGRILRLRLLHILRKKTKPYASPGPTLSIILKACQNAESDLGWAAREYLSMQKPQESLNTAKRALSLKARGAPFVCAKAALDLGRITLALRFNALGLSQDPGHGDLLIQRAVCYRYMGNNKEAFRFFRIAQESDSEYPTLLFEIGETYRISCDYEKAEEYFKKAVECSPHDRNMWSGLCSLYEDLYRFSSAETVCQQALQQNPESEWAFHLAGNFQQSHGLFDEALSVVEQGLKLHPDSFQLSLLRLEILERLDLLEEADKGYCEVLEKDPTNLLVQSHYAIFLTNGERYEEAFSFFETILIMDPDFRLALIGLARCHALKNNLQAALELVKRAMLTGPPEPDLITFFYRLCVPLSALQDGADFLLSLGQDVDTCINVGYLFEITDEYEQALRLYQKAKGIPGDQTLPLFRMGQVHQKRGEIVDALYYYKEVLKIKPRHYNALEGMVFLFLEQGHVQQAMETMEKLIGYVPDCEQALNVYIQIAEIREQEERAAQFLDSLAGRVENSAQLSLMKGRIAEAENNFDLAQQFYDEALEQDDAYPPALFSMAILQIKKRNHEGALSFLDSLLVSQPNMPEALVNRARVLLKMERKSQALADLFQALNTVLPDDDLEMEIYDLLAAHLTLDQIEKKNMAEIFETPLPENFYSFLGGAYERKGDFTMARSLYEVSDPFNPYARAYDALIGLTFIAQQENDKTAIQKITDSLAAALDEVHSHPELFSPLECASLHEAVAYVREGDRSLGEINESLDHWRYALKITRTPWALERAAYACLDRGEMTGDPASFREALVYLRELRNPIEKTSFVSPVLGDAYYFLGKHQEAVCEYGSFFDMDEKDPSLQPVFFRYLDALEKVHSPVKDITELAERKLESLSSDKISAPYRRALQERIFHNYVRTRQHGAALRSVIRSTGLFRGLFRYIKSIFI